ncbi:Slam-dependent surface lipoprotein [Neisseria montereyensis]|uniref:Hemoglobin-haptoglobin-utilization protein A n=1 Tax=Neisseria montereyensis TaxID=2973938 RepID=A0ABT2FBK3_9NEIS|nr:Slam-dependent surface lipoprotein [Neisseria montereyensis]MCS4533584.1 hemoglobin-haptoglobin-utilization protein A [Neisseria montereyensis]
MANTSFKRLYPTLALPILLAACAGGGSVEPPKVLAEWPVLESLDITADNVKEHDDNKSFVSITNNGGAVEKYVVTTKEPSWDGSLRDTPNDTYVYKTPDGKYYQFNSFSEPMLPGFSTPDKTVRTVHDMQNTADGGKFFACCGESTSTYLPAIDLRNQLHFGAWISPTGESHLFVGGKAADPAYMQGGSAPEVNGLKGKATYHVWGLRTKGDQVVSSTYTGTQNIRTDIPSVASKITVNFNTGKLGGEILGNENFGDSVVMQDVNVQGNRFSGSARSGNATGAVDGAFYGAHSTSWWSNDISEYAGGSIGGIVKFDGNKNLDTVFGGKRQAVDAEYKGTDLTPLE